MTRKLQRHGNNMALPVDETMMEILDITADTPLEITFHDGSMVVTPVRVGVSQEEVRETLDQLRPRYKRMLENLS